MSYVFVLNTDKSPLIPCSPKRARILLTNGKVAVFRMYPFTIILKEQRINPVIKEHRVKIDPGSKVTGMAVLQEDKGKVVWAAEIEHRGNLIKKRMDDRRAHRRSRRDRKTRYRRARFLNRTGKWRRKLPPSLESRVCNVLTWVSKLRRFSKVTAISMELVKFDTQKMMNSEISGIEYQQGELQGYEVKEYLLEKWDRKCAYCGKGSIPLQIDHIQPRSKGGSNRITNLCLACEKCNQKKNNDSIDDFLRNKPDLLKKIKSQAKTSLKDAAAVNVTRWELFNRLKETGLPIECGSGGLTKFNRTRLGLPKKHWVDAACVGKLNSDCLQSANIRPLLVKAFGHGRRQRCRTDKFGFPKYHLRRDKPVFGYQTGDMCIGTNKGRKNNGKICVGRATSCGEDYVRICGVSMGTKNVVRFHLLDGYDYF